MCSTLVQNVGDDFTGTGMSEDGRAGESHGRDGDDCYSQRIEGDSATTQPRSIWKEEGATELSQGLAQG